MKCPHCGTDCKKPKWDDLQKQADDLLKSLGHALLFKWDKQYEEDLFAAESHADWTAFQLRRVKER